MGRGVQQTFTSLEALENCAQDCGREPTITDVFEALWTRDTTNQSAGRDATDTHKTDTLSLPERVTTSTATQIEHCIAF